MYNFVQTLQFLLCSTWQNFTNVLYMLPMNMLATPGLVEVVKSTLPQF